MSSKRQNVLDLQKSRPVINYKKCAFQILRLRKSNNSRRVNAVSPTSVTTRISTEGTLENTQTTPSTVTSISALETEGSADQIAKSGASLNEITTTLPISSEFWTSGAELEL